MFSDDYGMTLIGRTGANNFTYSSTTVQSFGSHTAYFISFDSNGNLSNIEINNNVTSSYYMELSQSSDGSIYIARYIGNSWNDSSGNQYNAGLSFAKFVNGSMDWVRIVNTTSSVYYVGYYLGT